MIGDIHSVLCVFCNMPVFWHEEQDSSRLYGLKLRALSHGSAETSSRGAEKRSKVNDEEMIIPDPEVRLV